MVTIKQDQKTAELVGILLGDGSFYISKNNHEIDIALNSRDLEYKNHVKELLESVTNSYVFEKWRKTTNCVSIKIARKEPVDKLLSISLLKAGNKIKNRVVIPKWVWKNKRFVAACVKGLIDTDGSIYRLRPQWPNLFQLSFKNNNASLLKDVWRAFVLLGFKPSRIFGNRIVITRQEEINRYFQEVGTKNDRNLEMERQFQLVYKDKMR